MPKKSTKSSDKKMPPWMDKESKKHEQKEAKMGKKGGKNC